MCVEQKKTHTWRAKEMMRKLLKIYIHNHMFSFQLQKLHLSNILHTLVSSEKVLQHPQHIHNHSKGLNQKQRQACTQCKPKQNTSSTNH